MTSSTHEKTLIIVDSRKGGTGKTTTAMLVMETLADRPGVWCFDFGGEDGELRRRYDAVPVTPCAGKIAPFFVVADALLNSNSEVRTVVVDVGALQDDTIDRFLTECGVAELARDGSLRIVVLWVCDANPFALPALTAAMDAWGPKRLDIPVSVVLVGNEGRVQDPGDLSYLTSSATGKSLKNQGVGMTTIPRLEGSVMQGVQLAKMRFSDYVRADTIKGEPISRSRRMTVQGWLTIGQARLELLSFFLPADDAGVVDGRIDHSLDGVGHEAA